MLSQAKDWLNVSRTVDGIYEYLVDRPVSFIINYDEDCWRWYESGVISGCATDSPYYHSLVIVGREYQDDKDYWIGVNSWGPDWGLGGLFHVAVEDGDGVSLMNKWVEAVQVTSTVELYDDDACAGVQAD